MIVRRWETDQRYYLALLYRDLLGEWVLHTAWGGKRNALGNERCIPIVDESIGFQIIERIDAVRRRHGYRLIPESVRI